MILRQKSIRRGLAALALALVATGSGAQNNIPQTEIQYLSGRGCDDKVQWDFLCTEGRNSGTWGKIGVPSCWETEGYGTYQYGMRFYGIAFPEGVAAEKGMYKREFDIPAEWRGRQVELVFEACMTDTEAKINGRKAVGLHQGGFYRFTADVTDRVNFGKKNKLEVTVNKESKDASVNLAERRADYWNFGGIIRPVFLRAKPAFNLRHIAIDAKADGTFRANCYTNIALTGASIRVAILDASGKKVAKAVTPVKTDSDWCTAQLNIKSPALWTAETPNRYTAVFTLLNKEGNAVHTEKETFGFRTIEVRESDGLYINGVKVNIRGVNRHSFRPETGRTLSKAKNIEDVVLIKSMNMNAVRLSHYPADPDFLHACDSLGLYVMNELTGWHGKYTTAIGQPLIRSLVERDVNHPSVIWWSNGNEKGWNDELNGEFHKYDPQLRPVLHPQGNFGGFETMHYRSYGESQNYMRLPEIFMPTEFLHGLYDGGHGAGLHDYWEMMRRHPRCAGGFLWVLADEGVARVDMEGFIDNQGNFGADGLVGPHHEKEGSYYTVKQIWCPVQLMNEQIDSRFDGNFSVENRYDFLNLNTCRFVWKQIKLPASGENTDAIILKQGEVKGANIPAHGSGTLTIPAITGDADALSITIIDAAGDEIFTRSYPVRQHQSVTTPAIKIETLAAASTTPTYKQMADALIVTAGNRAYTFSRTDGQLKNVSVDGNSISFANGPRFIGLRRGDRSLDQFYNHDDADARKKERTYEEFPDAAVFTSLDVAEEGNRLKVTASYRLGNIDRAVWNIAPDGTLSLDYTYNFSGVVDMMGVRFDYPEDKVLSKRWVGDGPYRVWQNRLHGPQYGVWENNYNDPIPGESFTYPEFKGFFSNVSWMDIRTKEGTISIQNHMPDAYIGVYQPRDGRDRLLYTFPDCGISVLNVIPPVRNKVNTTDLCGPSSQPKWVDGIHTGRIVLRFDGNR